MLLKMKIILSSFVILIIACLNHINPAYAWEIKERNEYLIDIRGDEGDIYLNRFSINKKIASPDIQLSAFAEGQWNLDTSEWEKITIGMEAVKTFLRYLYIGQSLHFISGQMLDYMVFDTDARSIDTTTKVGIYLPLIPCLSLHLSEEYSFNIQEGLGDYSESGSEIILSLKDSYSVGLGWRHTDRIHALDTDYATLFLNLKF